MYSKSWRSKPKKRNFSVIHLTKDLLRVVLGITQQKTIMLINSHLSNECWDIHWVRCKSHPKDHSSFYIQELSYKVLQLFMFIQGSCSWNDRMGESPVLNKSKIENSNSSAYPLPKDTYRSAHSRSICHRPSLETTQITTHCRMDQYIYSRIQHISEKKQTDVPHNNMENLTNMWSREKSQTCIHSYCMNPFIWNLQTDKTNL